MIIHYCSFALSENKYYENLENQQSSVRHAISYYQFTPHFEPPGSMYDWNESSVGLQLIEFFTFIVSADRLWYFYSCFVLLSVSVVMVSHGARCVSGAVVFCWAFGILLKFTTAPRKRYKITASFLCVRKCDNSVCEKVCADAKRPFLISLSNCIAITVLH